MSTMNTMMLSGGLAEKICISPSCVVSRSLAAWCCVVVSADSWTSEESRDSGTETGPVLGRSAGRIEGHCYVTSSYFAASNSLSIWREAFIVTILLIEGKDGGRRGEDT